MAYRLYQRVDTAVNLTPASILQTFGRSIQISFDNYCQIMSGAGCVIMPVERQRKHCAVCQRRKWRARQQRARWRLTTVSWLWVLSAYAVNCLPQSFIIGGQPNQGVLLYRTPWPNPCSRDPVYESPIKSSPHEVKGALSDDDVHVSVCLSSVAHMWRSYENYQTNQRENVGQCWDHENWLPDVVFWRHQIQDGGRPLKWKTLSRHTSVTNDTNMIKVHSYTKSNREIRWGTMIEMIWPTSNF